MGYTDMLLTAKGLHHEVQIDQQAVEHKYCAYMGCRYEVQTTTTHVVRTTLVQPILGHLYNPSEDST